MLFLHQGPKKATKKVLESRRGAKMMLVKTKIITKQEPGMQMVDLACHYVTSLASNAL